MTQELYGDTKILNSRLRINRKIILKPPYTFPSNLIQSRNFVTRKKFQKYTILFFFFSCNDRQGFCVDSTLNYLSEGSRFGLVTFSYDSRESSFYDNWGEEDIVKKKCSKSKTNESFTNPFF